MKNCNDNCIAYEKNIKVDSLAKAYVPFQKLCPLYNLQKALKRGTVFPELDKPYIKNKAKKSYY